MAGARASAAFVAENPRGPSIGRNTLCEQILLGFLFRRGDHNLFYDFFELPPLRAKALPFY